MILALISLPESCTRKDMTVPDEQSLPETLLLKDFNPRSIFNVTITDIRKARHPVIDMHAHHYAGSVEEAAEWAGLMDELGMAKCIIMTQATGARFDSIIEIYQGFPNHFEVWCGIDYSRYKEPDFARHAVAELVRCFGKGARGVGELGDKGKGLYYCKPPAWGMHSDDPRMDPLFDKCAELELPVNIHVADPKWMYETMDSTNDGLMNAYKWRLDNQPDIVGHQGMINILERTIKRHPRTTFVACHLANCCYDLEQAGRLLDSCPNLYFDIGARFAELTATPRASRQFIQHYADRILYGTDMGIDPNMYRLTFRLLETADEHVYHRSLSYHWPCNGLDLPEQTLEMIYHQNALGILYRSGQY